jgi:hypothetical protein
MNALSNAIRWLSVLGGVAGMLVCGWAFVDPSILPAVRDAGPFAPPSTRYRSALGFVVALAVFAFGTRRLRHRSRP